MKNYKLDTALLPTIWLTWTNKDGRLWMNENGRKQNYPEPWMLYENEHLISRRYYSYPNGQVPIGVSWSTRNNDKLWVKAGSQLYYVYAKYHKDIDRLELAAVKYDTTRGDHKHQWMFDGDRFFIGKDKSVINQNGEICTAQFNVKKGYIVSRPRDMMKIVLRLNANDNVTQEFKKFIGHNYFTIGNGTSVNIESPWQISKWYESKQRVRAKGKAQELTDKLVAMPLGEIDHLTYKYGIKRTIDPYSRENIIKNFVYFERVNDEWSVLRALARNDDNTLEEMWRVYLSDDGVNRIVAKSDNDWVPSSQSASWYGRSRFYFANPDEAREKCNRIKYILPIITDEARGVDRMITALRFSEVEQLYKMGYQNLANTISGSGTPKAEIKKMFGGYYNEKENGVLKRVGMTKYQMDQYYELRYANRYHSGRILEKMRETLGDDLSHIDNATYDKYLRAFSKVLGDMWYINYVDNLNIDKDRFWKNIIKLGEKHANAYTMLNDTLSAYFRLRGNRPEIDWIFDGYSDLVRAHDVLIELKNEEDRERRAYWSMAEAERLKKDEEKRKEVDEKRKCYEYEEDEFIIRLPKNVNEIINEGSHQRICIGGYTTRHSKGETNLFFLRRKDDEDTPFYAIEMNNDKRIVQIHGFGNKWLGNNPEAIPTAIRWLRKNGIKCDDKILTCKATGYGVRNDYVPMPIVD